MATGQQLDIPAPRPWRIEGQAIWDADGVCIVSAFNPANMATRRLIVEAVNERDRLRKAFEDISEFADGMTSEEDEANVLTILDICAKALEGM
jgi:hypothetical protein